MTDIKEKPTAKDKAPPKPKKRPGRPLYECAKCGKQDHNKLWLCKPVLFGPGGCES
jgi:hypothetical protein